MSTLFRIIFNPINKASEFLGEMFDTSPQLMSEETARKLKNKQEARRFVEEIRNKRDSASGYTSSLN